MKLLLDEMHAPAVAAAVVDSVESILAVASVADLRGLPDADILVFAASEGFTVVTENVADFSALHAQWLVYGRPHAGIVLTSPKRFNRASLAYPGVLIAALKAFADAHPEGIGGRLVWLT